jgi:hypothetical protein
MTKARDSMAEQPPSFQFEDISIDEARRIGRGPRIDPALYRALQQKMPDSPGFSGKISSL